MPLVQFAQCLVPYLGHPPLAVQEDSAFSISGLPAKLCLDAQAYAGIRACGRAIINPYIIEETQSGKQGGEDEKPNAISQ